VSGTIGPSRSARAELDADTVDAQDSPVRRAAEPIVERVLEVATDEPRPIDVEIHLVDRFGRRTLREGQLQLRTVAGLGEAGQDDPPWVTDSVEVDATGTATWRPSSRRIELVAYLSSEAGFDHPLGCSFEPRVLELRAEVNVVEVAVERLPRIVFFLLDGEQRHAWQEANVRLGITVTPLDGSGGSVEFGENCCFLPSAGRYRLELEPPATYEPIESFVIDVATGETIERDLRLVSRT
jgi:hypothetical protein